MKESFKSQLLIKFKEHDITKYIFSHELVLCFLLLPFYKCSGFDYIPGLSLYCNAMLAFEASFFVFFAIIKRKMSGYGYLILAYGIWAYLIAPHFSGYEMPSSYYILGALAMIKMVDYGFFIHREMLLKAFSDLSCALLVVNLIQLVMMPNGFDGNGLFLLGIRTGFSIYTLSGMLWCALYEIYIHERVGYKTLFCLIISFITLALKWVGTGLTELLIIMVFYVCVNVLKFEKIKFWMFSVFAIILNYLIVFVGSSNFLLSWFVVNVLHKDLTFTSRRDIWDVFIDDIIDNPIWGYGKENSLRIPGVMITRQSHNQWLYYLHESGVIGGILILLSAALVIKRVERITDKKIYHVLGTFVFVTLVAFISEIQCYVPMYYGLFEIVMLVADD